MTVLDRYLARDVARAVIAGTSIFVGLVLVRRGYGIIEIVLSRDLGVRLAAQLLALALPSALAYAVPMASLFSPVSAYSRLRTDREYLAALAVGISPRRLALPVLPVAAAVAAAAFMITAVWEPQAVDAVESGAWLRASDPLAALPEGVVGRVGDRTIWAGRVDSREKRLERILIASVEEGRLLTLIAPRATWTVSEGVLRIGIENGSIVERDREGRTHRARFVAYEVPIPIEAAADGGRYTRRAPLARVLAERAAPEYAIEWQRRLAPPIACFAFFLLGPALGMAVGRTGRTASFAVCAVVFIAHYVLSGAVENGIARGGLPAVAFQAPSLLWGAAGAFLLARAGRPA